jgi:hypothetical protein
MDRLVCRFERQFAVWAYSVSHQRLMLRAVKDEAHATRVDVVFYGVEFLNMPTELGRLELYESDDAPLRAGGTKTYRVLSDQEESSIVASYAGFEETSLEYHQPSPIWDGTQTR